MDVDRLLLSNSIVTALAVWEGRSMTAAGRRLGLEQSSVSRRVRELEDRLGVSLFERHAHGVRPTQAGQRFFEQLLRVRQVFETAVAEAHAAGAARTGFLSLGFMGSFGSGVAAAVLARLRQEHPGIALRLCEAGSEELSRRVMVGELDCAWIARWRSPDPGLRVEPLWTERLYLATAEPLEAPLANWADVAAQPLLCPPRAEWRALQRRLRSRGLHLTIQVQDCSRETLLSLVSAGQGAALFSDSVAERGSPGVCFTPMEDTEAAIPVCMIYLPETDNPALRRLLAITRAHLGALGARSGSAAS